MKYIFFTYNLLTLSRAIRYTDEFYGKENTLIIFSDFASNLPNKIKNDYNVKFVSSDSLNNGIRGLKLIYKTCMITNKIWKIIDNAILKANDPVSLILFRDNEVQEITWINRTSKKYGNKVNFCLMEEGAGLYAKTKPNIKYKIIKKIIYLFFGIFTESVENCTQGMNKKVTKIICTKPDAFRKKRNESELVLEQMIDIFVPSFNEYMVKAVIGKKTKVKKYDYVFLTQPFHDFRSEYEMLLQRYTELLPVVFSELSKNGNTVIKLHPREQYDYSIYTDDHVDLPNELEQQLPFECLMKLYGNPQMISMFSSASINISTTKPSLYIGEWFGIPGAKDLFDEEFYIKNNIKRCSSYNEFVTSIYKEEKNVEFK